LQKIKAIMYGLGAMGQLATKLLVEKGVEIVGAIGHRTNIGLDIGELAGVGYPLGVKLSTDAEAILSRQEADIALVCATGGMEDMLPVYEKCIKNRLNVITLAEEAFFPWRCAPQIALQLDDMAKRYGVTITGSGVQDVFWLNLVSVLTAASHSIEMIQGETTANLDDYGPVVLNKAGIGKPADEWRQMRQGQEGHGRGIFELGLQALAADLGLTVDRTSHCNNPIIAGHNVVSHGLGRDIERGQVMGVSEIDEITTHQDITLKGILTGKVFESGDTETNLWVIKGVPELHLENRNMPGQLATCTIMVNRIPDVIACQPGFVTVERLPRPKYRPLASLFHERTIGSEIK
jgi:hypothetical protein